MMRDPVTGRFPSLSGQQPQIAGDGGGAASQPRKRRLDQLRGQTNESSHVEE